LNRDREHAVELAGRIHVRPHRDDALEHRREGLIAHDDTRLPELDLPRHAPGEVLVLGDVPIPRHAVAVLSREPRRGRRTALEGTAWRREGNIGWMSCRGVRMRHVVAVMAAALTFGGCASTDSTDRYAGSRVRVVSDAQYVRDCERVGTVADNEMEDLQKKAARIGGDVALMTPERRAKGGFFGMQDYETADVYRCKKPTP
jgi:hypothetical protein